MARKPIHLELTGGKGLRQRMWDRIRALHGAEFTLRGIVLGAESLETARDYVLALERGGYIESREEPNKRGFGTGVKIYRLAIDCGAEAPRVKRDGTPVTQGLAQEQMWRTLRMTKGDINARELAAHASTPMVAVTEVAAKGYLKMLNAGGYLDTTRKGHGHGNGGVLARYKLLPARDTGPRPPMVCRTKVIYDPNENRIVWQPPVTEEDAIHGR